MNDVELLFMCLLGIYVCGIVSVQIVVHFFLYWVDHFFIEL